MDPQEITDSPVQAVQHPFVYDGSFKVRVYKAVPKGRSERLHVRMDSKTLHQHDIQGTSPTGQLEEDGLFYGAQLVHYGLPVDRLAPRAIKTLKDVFRTKLGAPTLCVPDTIRSIERKLKREYEVLAFRAKVMRLLKEKRIEVHHWKIGSSNIRISWPPTKQLRELISKG